MGKRFVAARLAIVGVWLCALALSGCGAPPERQPEEVVRGALEAMFPYPNAAYRAAAERLLQDPANFTGDGAIRVPNSEAENTFRNEMTDLFGDYFTADCLDDLIKSGTLGLEYIVQRTDVQAEVGEITVTPLEDGNNYSFSVTLICTTPEGETQGTITGSAQCLKEDKGKIGYLRWEADKALLRNLGL